MVVFREELDVRIDVFYWLRKVAVLKAASFDLHQIDVACFALHLGANED